MSVRWEELERIFDEAQRVPAADRARFVARACGDDEAMRMEALSLLSADSASGEFMAAPALERLAQRFAAEGSRLQRGRHIGAYTIVERLGAGGAGEVWRARDERLGRDVAIKMLLPHLSGDPGKLRRFADEARSVGALNHPNILVVHDVGEHDGMPYIVSECLQGRTLRQRLEAGAVPANEATAIAIGVAHGLVAAHERGIVHRDLKPENVFLKSDGGVKLLDFGLAKLRSNAEGLTPGLGETATGLIAGTAGYMSPEQARGEPADPRSDLFALGVILYEMLAGRHPFRGASDFETLHAVLTTSPPDLDEHVPASLSRIVMRLVEKSPEARFQSARDLGWSLAHWTDDRASPVPGTGSNMSRPDARTTRWAWIAVPLLAAVATFVAWRMSHESPVLAPPSLPLTRFTWALPTGMSLASAPVVSPDGRHIAFTASDAAGTRLFLRDLGSLEARPIAGSEGAVLPFWSPDGRALGFFSDTMLMTLALPDGAPTPVAEAMSGRGAAWTASGTIVFAPDLILAGLNRVPADGGPAGPATVLDTSLGDTSHWWPVALPDGIHFLYFVRSRVDARRGIYLGRLDRPAAPADKPLFRSDSGVVFVSLPGGADGEMFYRYGGRLEARRIDLARMEASASARTLGFPAGANTLSNPVMLGVSLDVLAYAESSVPIGNRLVAYSMDGEKLRSRERAEIQNWPRVSPDGRLLARMTIDNTGSKPDIWVEDLERGTQHPVTSAIEPDMFPVWSPDGRQLAYVNGALPGRHGERRVHFAAADGTGIIRSIPCPGEYCEPSDWSRDGASLLVTVVEAGGADVWIVPAQNGDRPRPLLNAEFLERDARFSPDGRWVAYVSVETGMAEVSVRNVDGPPRRIAISSEGGAQPVWRRDGGALFFVDPQGALRAVPVRWADDGTPEFSLPEKPDVPPIGFGHWGTQYDVSPDGNRIYFLRRNDDPPPREIQVVVGWRALLN